MLQGFFEVPIEEIAEFQAFIFQEWGDVEIVVQKINEHVHNRRYIARCDGCGEPCLLGFIKMVDNEPSNLYVPRHGPHSIDD